MDCYYNGTKFRPFMLRDFFYVIWNKFYDLHFVEISYKRTRTTNFFFTQNFLLSHTFLGYRFKLFFSCYYFSAQPSGFRFFFKYSAFPKLTVLGVIRVELLWSQLSCFVHCIRKAQFRSSFLPLPNLTMRMFKCDWEVRELSCPST